MNVLSMTTDQRYYKPQFVNATAVSPAGNNPGMPAHQITARIMSRKVDSGIPIELHAAIGEARFYGEWDSMARLQQSLHNLRGSILLQLKSEAEEGSLAMEWIKKQLVDFDNPIANYTPVIPTLRHPEKIIQAVLGDGTPSAGATTEDETPATSPGNEITDHLKKAFMSSMGKKLEIQQALNDELLSLGAGN